MVVPCYLQMCAGLGGAGWGSGLWHSLGSISHSLALQPFHCWLWLGGCLSCKKSWLQEDFAQWDLIMLLLTQREAASGL